MDAGRALAGLRVAVGGAAADVAGKHCRLCNAATAGVIGCVVQIEPTSSSRFPCRWWKRIDRAVTLL